MHTYKYKIKQNTYLYKYIIYNGCLVKPMIGKKKNEWQLGR